MLLNTRRIDDLFFLSVGGLDFFLIWEDPRGRLDMLCEPCGIGQSVTACVYEPCGIGQSVTACVYEPCGIGQSVTACV